MTKPKKTVFVVDDDLSVCLALERLLKSVDLEVKTFRSPQDFLCCVKLQDPGCLILDIRMPQMSGLEMQAKLLDHKDNRPIIFLTGFGSVSSSVRAMKAGAMDFLEKPVDDQILIDTVFSALEKDRRARQKQSELRLIHQRLQRLTLREQEVLGLLLTGKLNKEVAYKLGTAEKTIKMHRKHIMEKMECRSVAELARLAEKAEQISI